ncbi:MAG: Flp pilus assembly complex ATPase component TadA [Eubacterium sp.]|nr:Flp pilus assembly complex ATPase component TadA [Eubacterium sp.]
MENLKKYIPREIEEVVQVYWKELVEIRLRIHQPLILEGVAGEKIVPEIPITEKMLKEILNKITNYSLYAYEREMKDGYITVEGGHRIGLAGEGTVKDGSLCGIRHIRFMNIRICRRFENYGDELLEKVSMNNQIRNTLIISAPGMGKTTLLRSLVQKCSDGIPGTSIVVIDERNEISGAYHGIPQIPLGIRTDVMTGMDKVDGIIRSVRSMGPKVIAVDELGEEGDMEAIQWAMNSGTVVFATIHGTDLKWVQRKMGESLFRRFSLKILIGERGRYQCFCEELEHCSSRLAEEFTASH